MSQNPEGQFRNFAGRVPSESLVEIPLFSDGENDTTESHAKMVSWGKRNSLVEIETTFSHSSSKSPVVTFFQSARTPSPKFCNANLHSPIDDSNCQDLDNDDYLKFNEDLTKAIQYQCSLFSPSLVRDINSDIKEIKRSLTVSDTLTDKRQYFPSEKEGTISSALNQEEVEKSRICINDQDNFETHFVYKYHRGDKHSKGYRNRGKSRYQIDLLA